MRLTQKTRFISWKDYDYNFEFVDGKLAPAGNNHDILNKLGQFEDIEDDFGFDLIKLLSAKKVYYMNWNYEGTQLVIEETYALFLNLTNRHIEYYENEYSEFTMSLEISNYGKNDIFGGWALSKEELENE